MTDVLSLMSSLGTLTSLGWKIIKRLGDFQDATHNSLPPLYQQLQTTLPLIMKSLEKIKKNHSNKELELSESSADVLHCAVDGCWQQISSLNSILDDIMPQEDDSRLILCIKGCKSLSKESQVREIVQALQFQLQVITFSQTPSNMPQMNFSPLFQMWLALPSAEEDFIAADSQHCEGTCTWFLEEYAYQRWKDTSVTNTSSRWLWLHGIPGTGKTVLASQVIRATREALKSSTSETPLLYFFFSSKDQEKQNSMGMLRSILHQLLSYVQLRSDDQAFLEFQHGAAYRNPAESDLLRLFDNLLERLPTVFVVIDGIDECIRFDGLIRIFEWFNQRNIHVFVTSQDFPQYHLSLSFVPPSQIVPFKTTIFEEEITKYIEERLSDKPKLSVWTNKSKLQEDIKTVLLKYSLGTFKWTACQLDDIERCGYDVTAREALDRMPKILHNVYAKSLAELDPINTQLITRILRWLSFAARPISLRELAEAVAISGRDGSFNQQMILSEPLLVLRMCPALIRIGGNSALIPLAGGNEEHPALNLLQSELKHGGLSNFLKNETQLDGTTTGTTIAGGDDQIETDLAHVEIGDRKLYASEYTVTLAHPSLKAYLLSQDILQTPASVFSLKQTESILYLAKASMGYLLRFKDPSKFAKPSQLQAHFSEHSMTTYCARYWISHAKDVDEMGTTEEKLELNEMMLRFFTEPETSYLCSLMIWDWDHHPSFDYQKEWPQPLYCAARNNLRNIVPKLLATNVEINAPTGMLGTALSAAAFEGHLEIVNMLLEAGADVEAKGTISGGALQASMCSDNIGIAESLLAHGADVNASGGLYGYPLQAAAAEGKPDFVQLMLESGAQVNAEGGLYGSALQAAASKGHTKIVSMLLDKDPTTGDKPLKESALRAATATGKAETVRLLIDAGADINLCPKNSSPALASAAYGGHSEIVEMLLSAGAEVDAQGGTEGTALYAAVLQDQIEIVTLLLKAGADPNIRIESPNTAHQFALHAASGTGRNAIVRVLLDAGADPHIRDRGKGTAFGIASRTGNWISAHLIAKTSRSRRKELKNATAREPQLEWIRIERMLSETGADVDTYLQLISEADEPGKQLDLQTWLYKANKYFLRDIPHSENQKPDSQTSEVDDQLKGIQQSVVYRPR